MCSCSVTHHNKFLATKYILKTQYEDQHCRAYFDQLYFKYWVPIDLWGVYTLCQESKLTAIRFCKFYQVCSEGCWG